MLWFGVSVDNCLSTRFGVCAVSPLAVTELPPNLSSETPRFNSLSNKWMMTPIMLFYIVYLHSKSISLLI